MELKLSHNELTYNLEKNDITNTNPIIEIKRIKLVKKIKQKIIKKFNLNTDFSIRDLYIYHRKVQPMRDAILTQISTTKLPLNIVNFINSETEKVINKLNVMRKNINNTGVNKIIKNNKIILKYEKYKIILSQQQYQNLQKRIVNNDYKK